MNRDDVEKKRMNQQQRIILKKKLSAFDTIVEDINAANLLSALLRRFGVDSIKAGINLSPMRPNERNHPKGQQFKIKV